jgi:hypothetical protein
MPIGFDFVSTLATAQKAAAMGAMDGMISIMSNLVPVFPEAKDKINIDQYIDERAAMAGTPTTIIWDADHVAKVRAGRAQVQQQQMQQQQMHNSAQTAKVGSEAAQNLSATQIGGGASALSALLKGGQ